MNLHEYQAKAVLRDYGIPTPRGVVVSGADQCAAAAAELGGSVWVAKAQIHAGGRGKAGGVKLVRSSDELAAVAGQLLGSRLTTYQNAPDGQPVSQLLIEETLPIARELYLSITVDRAAERIGFVASAALLLLFAVLGPDMPPREIVGKVAVQAVPAAMGAVLARKQFSAEGHENRQERAKRQSYASELFLMTAGALFIAFNVAPTEEMILIAYQMTPWHSLALAIASVVALHLLVFRLGFAGQEVGHGSGSGLRTFLHFTLAGYGVALLVSLYILWTFSRTDGGVNPELAAAVIVLGFPASIGAALARLLV